MAIDLSGITEGMDVYSRDDDCVGQVTRVEMDWQGGSGHDTGNAGWVDAGSTPNTWIEVTRDPLLGLGPKLLYVPSTQIAGVSSDRVTLYCDKDACLQSYQQRPPGL
jgi:hypothetical protein